MVATHKALMAEGSRMRSWISRFAWLMLWLFVASGCDMPPSAGTPAQQSKYALDRIYKDPKAQALALAAEQGNAAEVQRLMKQEHVNPDVIFADDDSGMPLVAWPVFTLNATGLKAMLDNGANPNARKPGRTVKKFDDGSVLDHFLYDNAMVWAAKQGDPIYLKLLLDHGGDPNTRNGNDEDLLFQAFIWHRQWQNVQVLVDHGADVNALSQQGSILYDYASSGGFEQAYWLLQRGSDPTTGTLIRQSPPPALPRYLIVESIFWYPTDPKNSLAISWQRKCQQWLLQHGYKRPPLPDAYRDMRKSFGFPYEENDIPLL
jgi:hypothetical protein